MRKTYHNQASTQKAVYPIDFTNSLLTGVTVSSAIATHSVIGTGSTAVTCTCTVATPIVYVDVPTGLTVGGNAVDVVVTTSDSNVKPVHRLIIITEI